MGRGHIQQRGSGAGLRVEERCGVFSGERRDGVWGNVGPRLALEISQSWFGLLLVPKSRERNNSSVCAHDLFTGCCAVHNCCITVTQI